MEKKGVFHIFLGFFPNSSECDISVEERESILKEIHNITNLPIIDFYSFLQEESESDFTLSRFLKNNPQFLTDEKLCYDAVKEVIRENPTQGFIFFNFKVDDDFFNMFFKNDSFIDYVCFINMCKMTISNNGMLNIHTHRNVSEYLNKTQNFIQIGKPEECVKKYNREDFGEYCELAGLSETYIINQLALELCESTKLTRQFPGTHPIHLTFKSIEENIKKYSYMISKKINGVRYMMIIQDNTLWFLNRKLEVWKGPKMDILEGLNNTILDCEVFYGNVVIVDVINDRGNCIRGYEISKRIDIGSRYLRKLKKTPFSFYVQEYFDISKLPKLLPDVLNQGNNYDGLIFTPKKRSYRLGRNDSLFKWKPNELNTIDLFYKEGELFCQGNDGLKRVEGTYSGRKLKQDNIVIEVHYKQDNEGNNIWVFEKIRKDKINPNTDWVVDNIVKCIKENISTEDLLKLINFYKHS